MTYQPDFVSPYNCTNDPQFPGLFKTMAILRNEALNFDLRIMSSKSAIFAVELLFQQGRVSEMDLDFVNYLSTVYDLYQLNNTVYKYNLYLDSIALPFRLIFGNFPSKCRDMPQSVAIDLVMMAVVIMLFVCQVGAICYACIQSDSLATLIHRSSGEERPARRRRR
ncbi:hypothetical protein B9Z55_024751 [Caenorhabditis nigoni]|uniref:Uncharacterized protein n=1 Tax=Caenorhabditis nigoni TaxID=1611254 RepID=A0A2G5SVZ5_9PELO|nr:hypothetical protein B9Z55_024751 [Caenorhabditis nigoni]